MADEQKPTSDSKHLLADRLFEKLREEDARFALDALGMTLIRTLLNAEPVWGKTRRDIFEDFMVSLRRTGEQALSGE